MCTSGRLGLIVGFGFGLGRYWGSRKSERWWSSKVGTRFTSVAENEINLQSFLGFISTSYIEINDFMFRWYSLWLFKNYISDILSYSIVSINLSITNSIFVQTKTTKYGHL